MRFAWLTLVSLALGISCTSQGGDPSALSPGPDIPSLERPKGTGGLGSGGATGTGAASGTGGRFPGTGGAGTGGAGAGGFPGTGGAAASGGAASGGAAMAGFGGEIPGRSAK